MDLDFAVCTAPLLHAEYQSRSETLCSPETRRRPYESLGRPPVSGTMFMVTLPIKRGRRGV